MANNDIIVSEMTSATQINTGDLMIMTQPDAQAETGYSTKKGTVLQVANKMLKGTEYTTDLPDFTDKTVLGGLEELKGDLTSLLPVDTASGAIANFDTDLALDLVSCKASIVASQPSGTPTPSSPLAISGYTGVNLTVCGKNLFDNSTFVKGRLDNGVVGYAEGTASMTITETGVNFTTNTNYRGVVGGFMPVKPSVTYYLKFTSSNAFIIYVDYYDINKTWKTRSNAITVNQNVTIPNDCYYARISIQGNTADDYTFTDIIFNYPNTDTTYHAYNGTTYAVSWQDEAGTVYGGNLDLTTGVLTVTWGADTINNLSFNYWGDETLFYCDISDKALGGYNLMCDIYEVRTSGGYGQLTDGQIVGRSDSNTIYIKDLAYTDVATFKANRGSGLIAYELATPQTYQLTPTQVRALVGVNNVFNDTNGNTEVSYKEGIQHYIDKKIAATQALIL